VIGTGEIGVLALENLQGTPVAKVTLMNRTRSRAEELAARLGGEVRDFEELLDALFEADFVISATSAQEPLVRYDDLKQVRQRRSGSRPLLIVDLANPRDFEERCGTLDEVFLNNLEDIAELVQQNIAERRQEIPRAEAIVDDEIATFFAWLSTLEVEPTILKLRALFHKIREEEVRSVEGSLDDEAYRQLERVSHRLVNRLLHLPTENLRRNEELRERGLVSLVHELLVEQTPHRKER